MKISNPKPNTLTFLESHLRGTVGYIVAVEKGMSKGIQKREMVRSIRRVQRCVREAISCLEHIQQCINNLAAPPIGDWSKNRLSSMSDNDKQRSIPGTQSNLGRNISNWADRDMVFPDNVLHMASECANKNHSAVFPESLPEWFINLFTQDGDVVLDPFCGSGTTLAVSNKMNRYGIGIDILRENVDLVEQRLARKPLLI